MQMLPCTALACWTLPYPAEASVLSGGEVLSLAERCAPNVAPSTLASIAYVESGNNPYALHDNTTGESLLPSDAGIAQRAAADWLANGRSVDVGLMQINSKNFDWIGISAEEALDPCISLAAAARILSDGFAGGQTDEQRQRALRIALSRYNTGSAERGFSNGYVDKVVSAAKNVVPAIKVENVAASEPLKKVTVASIQDDWDVWADHKPDARPPTNPSVRPAVPSLGGSHLPTIHVEKTARLIQKPMQNNALHSAKKESSK